MGGAFLSQPITTKKTNKYQHGKIRVVTCEMQGKASSTQAGESIWRTPFSSTASTKRSSSSEFSTDTEAWKSRSSALSSSPPASRPTPTSTRQTTLLPSRKPSNSWTTSSRLHTERKPCATSPSKTASSLSKTARSQTQ